jgi:hypothetical protein
MQIRFAPVVFIDGVVIGDVAELLTPVDAMSDHDMA